MLASCATSNAAFTGEPAGPAAELDREPAGISLAEIAETNALNASTCWQWRKQALAPKAFYRQLQQAQRDSRANSKIPALR
ncbi:hypothetical protein [Mycoavidus sp. SF9855]|uniref:hypothetical protein n=1 Tax=Mycoavidus sp. SF9855 TaxID=2968475 RepID=UPI00211BBD97|nr:hypothetical protein [Mycoavidus sp. SF9855]UUM20902.1 hypothetical protein NQD60_05315 [Mycoavidus sp. SF9855]